MVSPWLERRIAGRDCFRGVVRVDQLAALGRVAFREQTGERNLGESRIGIELRAIGPGDFLRFDHGVQCVGRIAPHRPQIESFENVQDLQRGDALAVRRQFKNVVAAVICRDRIDPRAGMFFEIGFAQITAVRLHEGVDLVRDLAFVESVASLSRRSSAAFSPVPDS